jgi:L-ascorbate metabolism protein UlaG (beta-lactamase superfamily)
MTHSKYVILFMVFLSIFNMSNSQQSFEKDLFDVNGTSLELWFIGHGTLMFKYGDKVIHIDPVSNEADYSQLPDADLILITHEHGDHLDPAAVSEIYGANTVLICNESSSSGLQDCIVMGNGDRKKVDDIIIEAVPAYNIKHERSPGNPFHPRGNGNGYILELGNKRIYVAGDTENIPEMSNMGKIDIAFLPMNLPYTMTPEMVAEAAGRIRPEILYPYHFGTTDTGEIVKLLKGSGIDVRIRKLN